MALSKSTIAPAMSWFFKAVVASRHQVEPVICVALGPVRLVDLRTHRQEDGHGTEIRREAARTSAAMSMASSGGTSHVVSYLE